VGLTDALDLRVKINKNKDPVWELVGSKAVTVFAPTNRAFKKLPIKLRLFLFSPFGGRVLKKILQYHVVPNYIVHTGVIQCLH
jgi:uncharacterized surface protein with fasciclin (FAS1) repeats